MEEEIIETGAGTIVTNKYGAGYYNKRINLPSKIKKLIKTKSIIKMEYYKKARKIIVYLGEDDE